MVILVLSSAIVGDSSISRSTHANTENLECQKMLELRWKKEESRMN